MAKTLEEKKATRRERCVVRIMHTCVHFTGIQHESCKAGINYHGQFGDGPGCFAGIPCTHEDEPNLKHCPKAEYPTREQAEEEEAAWQAHIRRAMSAMASAHDDAKGKGLKKGSGGVSSLKCPLCADGTLRYSVASYNGHMYAACTTPGCVSWME